MKPRQQEISGPFSVRRLATGAWQLCTDSPHGPELWLWGARPDEPELLSPVSIAAVAVEWRGDGVRVALSRPQGVRYLAAATAIVHEPVERLYENLPLAVLDADARRFWRRVFCLMRIPGGRILLRLFT